MFRRPHPFCLAAGSGVLSLGMLLLAGAPATRADVKIVESTTIDAPGFRSMIGEIPENQRAPLMKMVSPMLTGTPWVTTTYQSKTQMRTDMGGTSILVDSTSGRSITVNHKTQTYSVGAYDPFRKETGQLTASIEPAPEKSVVLGHPVGRYVFRMTSSVMPKATITGEIWSAPDLPKPLSPGYSSGSAGILDAEMRKVDGMPLAYKIVYGGTEMGDITVWCVAKSISITHYPKSVYAVPAGYRRGATGSKPGTPSVGFPLGDGMPLDTGDASADAADGSADSLLGAGGGNLSQMLGGGNASGGDLSQLLSGGNGGGGDLSQLLGAGGGGGGLSQLLGGSGGGDLSQLLGGSGGGGGGDLSQLLGAGGGSSAGAGGLLQSLQGMVDAMDEDTGE